jgi:ABC-type transport system substrate-binding protein
MKKCFVIFSLVVLMIATLAVGCGSPTTTAKPTTAPPTTSISTTTIPTTPAVAVPQKGGSLNILLAGSVNGVGALGAPAEVVGTAAAGEFRRITAPALEPLLVYDHDDKFYPKLAESWDIPADGKSITFHIRPNVKFSDGTSLDAAAVKYSLDAMAATTLGKIAYSSVSSIDVIDPLTVQFKLSKFDAILLYNLAVNNGLIVSPTAAKKPSTPDNWAVDHFIGTGGFKLADFKTKDFVSYSRFDNYWGAPKPYFDTIKITQVADIVTALMAFKSGQAQLIFGITPTDAKDLKAAGYDIYTAPARQTRSIIPSGANKDSPFVNLKVRQALEYAVDRNAIAASIGEGYSVGLTQWAYPTDAIYVPGLTPRNYDPAKAKQLLTEAGYPNGFKTTIISQPSENKDILVALQTYLKVVGIDATIDLADNARFLDMHNKSGWNGLLLHGSPNAGTLFGVWNRFNANVLPSMYRGTWQAQLDEALAEPDPAKRLADHQGLVKIVYDDAMFMPLWTSPDLSAGIKGLRDLSWQEGHPVMWEPANAWLAK